MTPTMKELGICYLDYADNPQQVQEFCRRHDLLDAAERAVLLVKKFFGSILRLTLSVKEDHETEDEWLVVNVAVQATPDQTLLLYRKCIQAWTKEFPWPAIGLLRLTYEFA